MSHRLPLEVVILSNGNLGARYESIATALPLVERVRVLERASAMAGAGAGDRGAEVVDCDWEDDAAAQAATRATEGDLPLVVVAAGEHVRILDEDQAQCFLAGAGTDLSVALWTPSGWEVRLQSPGPDASAGIGASSERRMYAIEIAATRSGGGWRKAGSPGSAPGAPGGGAAPARAQPDAPRFVIVAPEFAAGSGGIVALHSLCDRLNRLGYDAALCPLQSEGAEEIEFRGRDGWRTPIATRADLDGAVVVYPEIIPGNPLDASRVVR
ncbi:MAG: hypothetical protein QOG64_2488, partial [Acidimicrobiaceae bacterium]|nr:hypothetical protein [Acidimicrobiaceae bacterium]